MRPSPTSAPGVDSSAAARSTTLPHRSSCASSAATAAAAGSPPASARTAQAGNRRLCMLSVLRAHTKAPYKPDLLWETLPALNRPGRARTAREQRGQGREHARRLDYLPVQQKSKYS